MKLQLINIKDIADALSTKGYTTNHFLAFGADGAATILWKIPNTEKIYAVDKISGDKKETTISYIAITKDDCYRLLQNPDKDMEISDFFHGAILDYGYDQEIRIINAFQVFHNTQTPYTSSAKDYTFRSLLNKNVSDPFIINALSLLIHLQSLNNWIQIDIANSPIDPRCFIQAHYSDRTQILLEAIYTFWPKSEYYLTSYKQSDQPSKEQIIKWLKDRGLPQRTAKEIESSIRPIFAGGIKTPTERQQDSKMSFYASKDYPHRLSNLIHTKEHKQQIDFNVKHEHIENIIKSTRKYLLTRI